MLQTEKKPCRTNDANDTSRATIGVDLFHYCGKEYILNRCWLLFKILRNRPLGKHHVRKCNWSTEVVLQSPWHPRDHNSDDGPQFSDPTFSKFSEEWGFTHLTSSPHYLQSNGEAERAVPTATDLITKSEDPYLALLSYRSTPLHNGYTPAELLIGGKRRSTLPLDPQKLASK